MSLFTEPYPAFATILAAAGQPINGRHYVKSTIMNIVFFGNLFFYLKCLGVCKRHEVLD